MQIKIPASFLTELQKTILKFIGNQKSRRAKATSVKGAKQDGITIPHWSYTTKLLWLKKILPWKYTWGSVEKDIESTTGVLASCRNQHGQGDTARSAPACLPPLGHLLSSYNQDRKGKTARQALCTHRTLLEMLTFCATRQDWRIRQTCPVYLPPPGNPSVAIQAKGNSSPIALMAKKEASV